MWSTVASWVWDRREGVAKMVGRVAAWFRRPTAADGKSAAKGASLFRFEAVATSLLIGNFVTAGGELLAKNVAGYDHRKSVGSIRRLFEVLNALNEWEAAK